ncbi:MAG: NusG domain II-containing protein [Oscillospiraceae bacterium]|nr:NusG domain II-containing protein [Oscillospiraceae bacterium]
MKTKHWILLFIGLVLVALLAQLLLTHFRSDGTIATIYHQNIPLKTIDLGRVDTPYTFTVTGEGGAENVVLIESGQISIQSATCRDQICVHQGPIRDGTHPIVCLPHRVVIQIDRRPDDAADAVGG